MFDPIDAPIRRLEEAFSVALKDEYKSWLDTTDYDLPMGDMLRILFNQLVWKDELSKFILAHLLQAEKDGYETYRLQTCWYLTRILVGPNPTIEQVKRVYLNAFGEVDGGSL